MKTTKTHKSSRKLWLIMLLLVFGIPFLGGCLIVDDDPDDFYDYYDGDMDLIISPSYVYPVYDSSYREWRWYFDWALVENHGVGITLDRASITFYSLNGNYESTEDYSHRIRNWFGSDWLPPYGQLDTEGSYFFNSDSSGTGWKATFSFSGIDEYGNRITTTNDVTCASAQYSGSIGCSFYPNPVYPEYNYNYDEYRWYVDWSVFETGGSGVTLNSLWIDFYDIYGNYEESVNYTSSIREWFGTTYIPPYGELESNNRFWINDNGSGYGWIMQFSYRGVDQNGNTVSTSGSVTLEDAYSYRANDGDSVEENVTSHVTHIQKQGDEIREVKTIKTPEQSRFHVESFE